jgi:hypothetical protein
MEMGWTRREKEFNERTYNDVMVDLETLSTDTDAVVLSIGAVRFRTDVVDDPITIRNPDRSFYARLDTVEQEENGRDVNPDTMEWWDKQSSAARAVFNEKPEPVAKVLAAFTEFCMGAKRIWGNGNMFDNAIMRDLYQDYDAEYPVNYWQDLDVRTVTYMWNFLTNWRSKGKRPEIIVGEEHNALDDARRQVIQVQRMINELKGSKYES